MDENNFRIHPAIGIARVGDSDDYYIGPETTPDQGLSGGLPIKQGHEESTINSSDLRDDAERLKRQAARFKIYQYPPSSGPETYPMGLDQSEVQEIKIGSKVGDRTVKEIIWTVHVANKKSNSFAAVEGIDPNNPQGAVYPGVCGFASPLLPTIRNWAGTQPPTDEKLKALNDPVRVKALTIDPGPRTIFGVRAGGVAFDAMDPASYCDETGQVVELDNYPKSFPADSFDDMECPTGPIDSLGELRTDEHGRLLVLGGYGRACGWRTSSIPSVPQGNPYPNKITENGQEVDDFAFDVNNDQWFDDASDGPVSAVIVFEDGGVQPVQANAWVVTADPAYAPQTPNVVSLFDDIFDSWVRQLHLMPELLGSTAAPACDQGFEFLPENWFSQYNGEYRPPFDEYLNPLFRSIGLQRWTINLNLTPGVEGHDNVGGITAETDPRATPIQNLAFIRIPGERGNGQQDWARDNPLMPAALGDHNQSFLTVTPTQYFFLNQWVDRKIQARNPTPLGPGEQLDKAVLANCLGGRFSPGIDMTFTARQPDLYIKDWTTSGTGPFRVKLAALNYSKLPPDGQPLLTQGYVPLRTGNAGAEPGDLSKMMAIPWHTDYNSCATHLPSPNPAGNKMLFWSWPSQRPVAAFVAAEVKHNDGLIKNGLPLQQWSVRGEGTGDGETPAQAWGRYQVRKDILNNWQKIGVIINASSIDTAEDGHPLPEKFASFYLEAQSKLKATLENPRVIAFPNSQDQMPQ